MRLITHEEFNKRGPRGEVISLDFELRQNSKSEPTTPTNYLFSEILRENKVIPLEDAILFK